MTKPRRLGRGLEALLGRPMDGAAAETVAEDFGAETYTQTLAPLRVTNQEDDATSGLTWIGVYDIDRNPFQPRQDFDATALGELAESLTDHGMLQPVVVRRHGDRYQLVSGERRWRAATVAGWEKVPCLLWEADDRQMAELALVENIQRRDLNALEKAASFQHYLEQYRCTQEELAARVKIDRSTVANLIRLLELPEVVQDAVRSGAISSGHARALLPLGDEREQVAFCRRIQEEGLSVRATEELIRETINAAEEQELGVVAQEGPANSAGKNSAAGKVRRSQHVNSLEQELRVALGTKVDVRPGAKGKGKIVIHFTSHEEFDRLRAYFSGDEGHARGRVG
jgi:ParB family transcriptional regulator, chromosome partitioning protein